MRVLIDVPSKVAEIVANVVATSARPRSKHFLDVIAALEALPGADKAEPLTVNIGEYQVRVALIQHLRQEAEALAKIRDLSLQIAPEVVSLLPIGDFEGVLVKRYRLRPGERLVPLAETTGPLPESAVERFRQDLHKLVEHGFIHPSTAEGGHWYMGSESGTLLLERWASLDPYDEDQAEEMFRDVEDVIESRGVRRG
jgi:hypothetical protein